MPGDKSQQLSFFDKSFEEQVKIAIDYGDPKLLQILLGPKNCQLSEYWLIHSILSHNILAVIKTAECQLPINILDSQRSTLEGKFWQVNVENGDNAMCTMPTEKMAEVNKTLEEKKNKVLERYKSCMNSSDNSKTEMVSIPLFYDASRGVNYPMFSSLDECSERAKDIKKVVEKFKDNPAILPVLTLNFISQYNEIFQRISQEYQLKVTETDKIADLINELRDKYLLIANNDERVELVLDQLRENIINKIRDEEFIDEMYRKLLDNVLNAARNNSSYVLHQDVINTSVEYARNNIKENSNRNSGKTSLLNSFLTYAAEKTKPDLNIIDILLINGASLLNSYCGMDVDGRSQLTREYFLKSSNSDLIYFPDKSIFTIMKEAHKVLFDFPIMKGEINLAEVLSVVPSKFAEFKGDEKNKPILTKVGEKGEKKLMELLNDYKKLIEEKASGRDTRNIAEKLWSKLLNIFSKSANNQVRKNYTSVYKKLDECIEVGYLAVATGDDKVIIDYARVVKKEQEDERDEDVRRLYDVFLTILFEHQDLVKCSWWKEISYKSKRLIKWNPAWEKILTSPKLKDIKYNIPELYDIIPDFKDKNYDTRASEWSHNNHTVIQGRIEKKRLAQSEALDRAEEGKARAEEGKARAELKDRARKALMRQIRKFDDELGDVVEGSQDQIVDSVVNYAMEHRQHPLEPIVSTVMEEIKLNREQVISEGIVNAGLINAGIRSFLTDISVQPGTSCGHGMGRR